MKKDRVRAILQEAGKLPPAKARVLVGALCAKSSAAPTTADLLEIAASAMQAAIEQAILDELPPAEK